jgi:hypothetical protein
MRGAPKHLQQLLPHAAVLFTAAALRDVIIMKRWDVRRDPNGTAKQL